jgi:hypothetical protein
MTPHNFVKGVHPEGLKPCSLHLTDDFPVFLCSLTALRITCGQDRLPTLFAATSFPLSALLPALKGSRGDGDQSSFAPASLLARPAIQLCPSTALQMALPHSPLPILLSGGSNVSHVGRPDPVYRL